MVGRGSARQDRPRDLWRPFAAYELGHIGRQRRIRAAASPPGKISLVFDPQMDSCSIATDSCSIATCSRFYAPMTALATNAVKINVVWQYVIGGIQATSHCKLWVFVASAMTADENGGGN